MRKYEGLNNMIDNEQIQQMNKELHDLDEDYAHNREIIIEKYTQPLLELVASHKDELTQSELRTLFNIGIVTVTKVQEEYNGNYISRPTYYVNSIDYKIDDAKATLDND